MLYEKPNNSFLALRDSLLAFSQIEGFQVLHLGFAVRIRIVYFGIIRYAVYMYIQKIEMSLSLMITLVSSAYYMQNNISDRLQMLFMYIMSNRGPGIDPWGIPHLI